MEMLGAIAAVLGILTGIWFILEKALAYRQGTSKATVFVKQITLEKTPLFVENTIVDFTHVTALTGKNGVGKTAICEWVSGLESRENLGRWRYPNKHLPIIYSVKCKFKGEEISVRLRIEDNKISYFIDGTEVPEIQPSCKFIFIKDVRFDWSKVDELTALANLLSMEREVINEYIKRVGKSFYCTIQSVESFEEDSETNVYVTMDGVHPRIRLSALSQSEVGRVVLEVAFAVAQYLSKTTPVVVVVEHGFAILDKHWMQKYIDWITSQSLGFQTIFVMVPILPKVDWSKCKVNELWGVPPKVVVKEKVTG